MILSLHRRPHPHRCRAVARHCNHGLPTEDRDTWVRTGGTPETKWAKPDGGDPQMMPPAGRGGAGAMSMMEPDPMIMVPDPMTMEPDPMMGPVQDLHGSNHGRGAQGRRRPRSQLRRALDTGELYCWGRDIVEGTTATTTPARVEGLMGAVEDVGCRRQPRLRADRGRGVVLGRRLGGSARHRLDAAKHLRAP